MPRGPTLPIWTIYNRPKDYPRHFVARRFDIVSVGRIEVTDYKYLGKTLEAVRAQLPPGLYRLDRQPGDDPKIVEVWL